MTQQTDERQEISDDLWRTWAAQEKLRGAVAARKLRKYTGIVFVALALGAAFYVLVIR